MRALETCTASISPYLHSLFFQHCWADVAWTTANTGSIVSVAHHFQQQHQAVEINEIFYHPENGAPEHWRLRELGGRELQSLNFFFFFSKFAILGEIDFE